MAGSSVLRAEAEDGVLSGGAVIGGSGSGVILSGHGASVSGLTVIADRAGALPVTLHYKTDGLAGIPNRSISLMVDGSFYASLVVATSAAGATFDFAVPASAAGAVQLEFIVDGYDSGDLIIDAVSWYSGGCALSNTAPSVRVDDNLTDVVDDPNAISAPPSDPTYVLPVMTSSDVAGVAAQGLPTGMAIGTGATGWEITGDVGVSGDFHFITVMVHDDGGLWRLLDSTQFMLGAENVTRSSLHGDLIITEVLAKPPNFDAVLLGAVEIMNVGTAPIDLGLEGIRIRDHNPINDAPDADLSPLDYTIPATDDLGVNSVLMPGQRAMLALSNLSRYTITEADRNLGIGTYTHEMDSRNPTDAELHYSMADASLERVDRLTFGELADEVYLSDASGDLVSYLYWGDPKTSPDNFRNQLGTPVFAPWIAWDGTWSHRLTGGPQGTSIALATTGAGHNLSGCWELSGWAEDLTESCPFAATNTVIAPPDPNVTVTGATGTAVLDTTDWLGDTDSTLGAPNTP